MKRIWLRFLSGAWLLSPWAVLGGIVSGMGIGRYYSEIAPVLAPYGDMYLALLKMCILPVLLSAVASSLANLLRSHSSAHYLQRMILVLLGSMVFLSMTGLIGGIVGQPGSALPDDTRQMMTHLIKAGGAADLEMNFYSDDDGIGASGFSLLKFLSGIVPNNIFSSLSDSRNLQVLFFAVLIGLAAGSISSGPGAHFINLLESFYLAFAKIIRWAMYLLPFGLCCLLAAQVSQLGAGLLEAMAGFIIVFFACCAFIFVVNTVLIWYRTGGSLWRIVLKIKDPVMVALGTRSSLASLPCAIDAMSTGLGYDKSATRFLLPLGITVGRFGNVLYFSLAAVFVAQLYEVPLDLQACGIIIAGSILAGMATSGATGVLTLAMLSFILEPLHLPVEAALALFMAIDPIVDPARTLTIVYSSCTATALVAKKQSEVDDEREKEKIASIASHPENVALNGQA